MRSHRLLIASLPVLTLAGSVLASDSPLAWWKFDETSGSTAADSAGSFNGNLLGGAAFGSGVSGNAIVLGSNNSLVDMGNVLALTGTAFSMQTWVKTTDASGSSTVIAGKHNTGTFNGYMMRANQDSANYGSPGKASFYQANSPGNTAVGSTTITDGNWHHLLATYTPGGQLRLYVDGNLESTKATTTILSNSVSFMVGGATSSGVKTNYFNGSVDEVQVYGYELNSDEVKYLYANPGKAIPAPGAAAIGLLGLAAAGRRRR